MNVLNSFAPLANGEALDWNQIPECSLSDFIRNLSEELELGANFNLKLDNCSSSIKKIIFDNGNTTILI